MIFALLLLPPLLAAVLALGVRPYRPIVGWTNAALSVIPLAVAVGLAAHASSGGEAIAGGPGSLFRADALASLVLLCVTASSTLALVMSPGVAQDKLKFGASRLRRYHVFMNLFILAMLLAVSTNNVGVMWIAVEATTVFSALLIPLRLTKESVEASWKYILIGSVGIALAFAGTVLAYFDFVTLGGDSTNALDWPVLLATAPSLHPEVMRLAFVFLLVGYGTKAGIAPMHAWKPDAYGEAPAALTALMSSGLFAVAIYAIVRWKIVADAAGRSGHADGLLVVLGMLSLVIACLSVVLARNYRRMLAYSSIEHAGLVCIGLGLGPLGMFAALLHLLSHTAAKGVVFITAGNMERKYGSAVIADVRGVSKLMPITGALFAIGLLALMGLPPFGVFISEFALFRAGFVVGRPWLMGATLILLSVAFISFITHLNRMLYGQPPEGQQVGEPEAWRFAPLFVSVAVLLVLGLALPRPVVALLDNVVQEAVR